MPEIRRWRKALGALRERSQESRSYLTVRLVRLEERLAQQQRMANRRPALLMGVA